MSAGQLLEFVPWLASRAAGIVAYGLLSAGVIAGLLMSTRLTDVRRRARLRGVHEALALWGLAGIFVHGALLLLDGWLHPSPADLLIPFLEDHRRFFVGLGVLAMYGASGFVASFYLRRRIGAQRWRKLHTASFLVWLLGAVHTLGAGSDAGSPFILVLVLGTSAVIVVLLGVRVAGVPFMRVSRT